MSMKACLIVAVLAVALPSAATAACDLEDVLVDASRTATVKTPDKRVHFVQSGEFKNGCPALGSLCQLPTFVVPGDTVLTGKTEGEFTCASYVGAKGATTVGWIPTKALGFMSDEFAGHWIGPEKDITIQPGEGSKLVVSGSATYGASDPDRVRRGAINTGEIEGKIEPISGVLAFGMGDEDETLPYDVADEGICEVRMLRRGPFLTVRDNGSCGGAGVSFTGIYTRAK
ncbi:hypothetical protein SAMN05216548_108186 [Faunimonas pinastri]|uniref:Uncharacterized protein n=1 Tax=Faunimonas pinastri TaxID=1855383 RepID=A0A1H9JMI8_9HYPH|nr:hypothetical protein [Faunimonas pinastri]SEQ88072.1 hypothetical protein SAMN05216548_108186 [Faunimonas pinastri]